MHAGPLAAHVALHREHARFVVQPLCDVLADAFHCAAAGAGRVLRLVVHVAARQVRRQRLAPGALLGLLVFGAPRFVIGLFKLGCQLRDVAVQRLFDQALLLSAHASAELLAGDGVLQPPQVGDLVRELVDQRLLEGGFACMAREQLVLGRHLGHQRQQRLAHLLRVQGIELLQGNHGS